MLITLFAQTTVMPAESAPGTLTKMDTWFTGSMTISDLEFVAEDVDLEDLI